MTLKRLAAKFVPAVVLALGITGLARAGDLSVLNGSFETYSGGYGPDGTQSQLGNSATIGGKSGYSVLSDWTVGTGTYANLFAAGTAGTTGSYSPQYSSSTILWSPSNSSPTDPQYGKTFPNSSPDGGNYIGLDGGSSYRGTGISQSITGLTVGSQYSVTFYWAAAQQYGYNGDTTENVLVSLGGQSQYVLPENSPHQNPSHGFSGWMQETMVFTADSTTDALNFLAVGTPDGVPPFVLLDGVSLAAVPEPSSMVLMGLAAIGLGAASLRRRMYNRRRNAAAAAA